MSNTPDAVQLLAEVDYDEWTLGDAETVVKLSGLGFDEILRILEVVAEPGGYRAITPGLLVGVLFVEGRRRGDVTLGDVRRFKLTATLKALAEVDAVQTVAAGIDN